MNLPALRVWITVTIVYRGLGFRGPSAITKKTEIQIGNHEKELGQTLAMKLRRKTAPWLRLIR
jgi:hypothetical protein